MVTYKIPSPSEFNMFLTLNILALLGAVAATVTPPAVAVYPPERVVHLIPELGGFLNAEGLWVISPSTVTPANFTILPIPGPFGTVGYVGLQSTVGPCVVAPNGYGGAIQCAAVPAGSPTSLSVFQAFEYPTGSTSGAGLRLSLLAGGEKWYSVTAPTSTGVSVLNGPNPITDIAFQYEYEILVVPA